MQAPNLATTGQVVVALWTPAQTSGGPRPRLCWRNVRELLKRAGGGGPRIGVNLVSLFEEWSVAVHVRWGPGLSAHLNQQECRRSRSIPVLAFRSSPLLHRPSEGSAGQGGWRAVGGARRGRARQFQSRDLR